MSAPDTHLLTQWQRRRDAEAFSELVNRYSSMVFSVCRRMLGDAALAEDVAQECFIELMQGRVKVRSSLGALLHTMAVRRCTDAIKKDSRRRRRETVFADDQPSHANLANAVERSEVLSHIDTAMETLPARVRAVVIARFLEGQTHDHIAQRLGVAESTVRYRADQGVSRIRASLKRKGVAVGATALAAALAQSSEAAPSTLTQTMGKLSLGGVTSATALSTILSSWVLKGTAIALIVGAFGVGYWASSHRQAGETETQSIIAATAPTIPATTAAPEPTPKAEVTVPAKAPEGTQPALAAKSESAPKVSIQGRVYDAETGAGIAGVDVNTFPSGGGIPVVPSALTDADGAYQILDHPDGSYHVYVNNAKEYPKRYGDPGANIVLSDGGTKTGLDFALHRGIRVSGQVVDGNGEPVAGATVGANSKTLVNAIRQKSDADGRFVIFVPKHDDTLLVQAFTEDFESETVRQPQGMATGLEDVVLSLSLAKTASVSGVVLTEEGHPTPRAQVRLDRKFPNVFLYETGGTTDNSGKFRLRQIPVGEYTLYVYPENATTRNTADEYAHFQLTQGEILKGLEIIVDDKDSLSIAGSVVDGDGRPVSGVQISGMVGSSGTTHSLKDGSFQITGLKEGPCALFVLHHQYSKTLITIEAGTEDAEIVLKKRSVLAGRVVDAETGTPLKKYNFSYFMGKGEVNLGTMLKFPKPVEDDKGRFSIAKVSVGMATVAVSSPGYAFEIKHAEILEKEGAYVEFQMQPAPTFEGLVTNEAGKPLPDTKIYLDRINLRNTSEDTSIAITDQDGTFRFEHLSPKMNFMVAHHPGYGIGLINPATTNRIVLPKPGRLDGFVEGADASFSEMKLTLCYQKNGDQLPSYSFHPNIDGSFQLDDLTPGWTSIFLRPKKDDSSWSLWERNIHIESEKTAQVFLPEIEVGSATISGRITVLEEAAQNTYLALEQYREDDLTLTRGMRVEVNGSYRFENLQGGEWLLRIHRANPEATSDTVVDEVLLSVEPGEAATQDIALQPAW
jgi:RNA polymerase sigma factor (sigma-70 family)